MEMIQTPGGMRIAPSLPPEAVKSYQMISPPRPATCEEVGCEHYLNGWRTLVDESADLGRAQAAYIRRECGRGFTEARLGAMTVFTFEPGQRCFARHRAPAEGRERFRVLRGDWRGYDRSETREHVRAADWVEDFAGHQQRLADRLERG